MSARTPIEAVRIELFAPIASFRDPMFPGVSRGLPIPPPSTLRGLLAAATGRRSEPVVFGMAAWAGGRGVDAETYHPIAADGSNPSVGGRVGSGKGGTTIKDRPFLAEVRVTLWIPAPDHERISTALRRPVWGLRLGRSQDLVFVRSVTRVVLQPAEEAFIGHAVAPAGGHGAPQAVALRLAEQISTDRLTTDFADFLWCPEPPERPHQIAGAYRDGDQAVWLQRPPGAPQDGELLRVFGKSAEKAETGQPELLTEHSASVQDAAQAVEERIGSPGPLAKHPRFWQQVQTAALLHDAGKVAEGFQLQLREKGNYWGERHEVLSLAYVDLLTSCLPALDRKMIAAGVAFHHRCLSSSRGRELKSDYPPEADWERKFGRDPRPMPGSPRIQVPAARHEALLRWLSERSGFAIPPGNGRKLWERARDAFAQVQADWSSPVPDEDGLVAVLLQGAVTLADHSGSAHVPLQTHMPLPPKFITTLATPYPHQRDAAETNGHLILCAPTGSGKTEAGLAWASSQLEEMPGRPRLIWILPYRASIDAARDRFLRDFTPAPGATKPDIGVLHATAARTLLSRAVEDDCAPDKGEARKARARAGAMRLFAQRVRVTTPHQLLRAAIAGPRYSGVLLEQANALLVLDEIHAYDPATFGRLCASMRLWRELGSRIAVLSATLAPPMIELLEETLGEVTCHRATPGTAPVRHHLALDDEPIDSPAALERVRRWLRDGHSVLCVANTVDTAQRLYTELAPVARAALPDDPDAAILLHSRFRMEDRAAIERRVKERHPEREEGETVRRGGLVVSTQVLEVSLCLDFDRGVSELAPIEAVAQRAGRVNRRGWHPEGAVEFRVHRSESALPYDEETLAASLRALRETAGPEISEETIDTWLKTAYDTAWGRQWADDARRHCANFHRDFLTFPEPFADRSEHAEGLDEAFDSTDVLLAQDLAEYLRRSDEDPLLAEGLLIPVRYSQLHRFKREGAVTFDRDLRLMVVDVPYDEEYGLKLTRHAPERETVL